MVLIEVLLRTSQARCSCVNVVAPGGAVVALVRVTAYPLHHTANVAGGNETRTRTTPEHALRKT